MTGAPMGREQTQETNDDGQTTWHVYPNGRRELRHGTEYTSYLGIRYSFRYAQDHVPGFPLGHVLVFGIPLISRHIGPVAVRPDDITTVHRNQEWTNE